MDDVCIRCSRCLVAFNRKEGEFARHQGNEKEILLANIKAKQGIPVVEGAHPYKPENIFIS